MSIPVLKNYINGEWVESSTDTFGDVWNPALGEKIASVPYGNSQDVDLAVKAAAEAYPEWKATPPLARARLLFRLKEAFEEEFEDIATVLTTEQGKAIDEARGEVRRMIENVEHATGVTTMMTGYCIEDIARDIDSSLYRQPMGVFACVPPYNFPAMVPWWFIPYALVTGNTYVLKPSEQVPMTQSRIFEVIDEIGFPDGVINLVNGSRDVVNAILDHQDIQGVSFVGATPTAKYIYERCGATGKRVQSLGGAKNIVAIMPDANVDAGLPSLITSFFGCAGQRCLSGSILCPVGEGADAFIEKFVASTKAMKVGNGLDEATAMGPVVSKAHQKRVLSYIEKGLEEGADLVLDGRNFTVDGYPDGYFVGPTIFDNATPDMTIAKEEIFGPVVSIVRKEKLDDVIELINTRDFANAACIYTQDAKAVRKMRCEAAPGMIGVNIGIAAPMSFFPFGGSGNSMFGDIKGHGREIFQFFTDTKVLIERYF